MILANVTTLTTKVSNDPDARVKNLPLLILRSWPQSGRMSRVGLKLRRNHSDYIHLGGYSSLLINGFQNQIPAPVKMIKLAKHGTEVAFVLLAKQPRV